jgi:predicted esterase
MSRVPFIALLSVAVVLLPAIAMDPPPPGWDTIAIRATGKYMYRYIPPNLDPDEPPPVIVFLHGSGAYPHNYEPYVEDAANAVKAVLILPKSQRLEGWGDALDPTTISEALRLTREDLILDEARISIGGHSSGGAYACYLAYARPSQYAAVFMLSAPFFSIPALANPDYAAPVRMYYGTLDPNYINGASDAYRQQWTRLGVAFEEDIRFGYGHNDWPSSTMDTGFVFLTSHTYPLPPRHWRRAEPHRMVPGPLR